MSRVKSTSSPINNDNNVHTDIAVQIAARNESLFLNNATVILSSPQGYVIDMQATMGEAGNDGNCDVIENGSTLGEKDGTTPRNDTTQCVTAQRRMSSGH